MSGLRPEDLPEEARRELAALEGENGHIPVLTPGLDGIDIDEIPPEEIARVSGNLADWRSRPEPVVDVEPGELGAIDLPPDEENA